VAGILVTLWVAGFVIAIYAAIGLGWIAFALFLYLSDLYYKVRG